MSLVRFVLLLMCVLIFGACRTPPAEELAIVTAEPVVEPLAATPTSRPATQTPTPMAVSTASPVPTSTATYTPPPSEPLIPPSSTPESFSIDVPVMAVWSGEGEPQLGYLLELDSGKLLAPAENFGEAFIEDWLELILKVNNTILARDLNFYYGMTEDQIRQSISETGIMKLPHFVRTGYVSGNPDYPEVELRIIEWEVAKGLEVEIGFYSGNTPGQSPELFEDWEIDLAYNSMGYALNTNGSLHIKPRLPSGVNYSTKLSNIIITNANLLIALESYQFLTQGYFMSFLGGMRYPSEITTDNEWNQTGFIDIKSCSVTDFSRDGSVCKTGLKFIQK